MSRRFSSTGRSFVSVQGALCALQRAFIRCDKSFAEGLATLPVRSAVIYGEALVLRDDGHSDFHAMKGRGPRDALLVAFDLIQIDDEDIRREPIEVRRARLAAILDPAPDGVQFSRAIDGGGDVIFRLPAYLL